MAPALGAFWTLVDGRLEAISGDELAQQVQHAAKLWTARRVLHRMLEYRWEHLFEISERLDRSV